jgi:Predicted exonuclease of the beta-lactamase fold involved in RNA processing
MSNPTSEFSGSCGIDANLKVNFGFMIEVRYQCGVYLPRQDLWLDPWDARRLAFVSHAHSDHIAPHEEIIVSERTARFMQSRLPGSRNEHILPFGERRMVHGVDLMLLPAGHIFGRRNVSFFRQRDIALHRRF